MKIVLIRHIKSDWSTEKSDFERTIRADRRSDAMKISDALKVQGIVPDLIVSSSAKRTQQTANLFAKAFVIPSNQIVFKQSLYECSHQEIAAVIQQVPTGVNCVIIVCHNPAITDFINHFSNARIDNVPTCGCAVMESKKGQFVLEHFFYPKQLD